MLSLFLVTKKDYRIDLLKELFDDVLRRRINRVNSGFERPFYDLSYSLLDDDLLNVEALGFSVKCKPNRIEAGFKAVVTEIERVYRYGISEPELASSKNALAIRMKGSLDTSSIAIASRYKSHFLETGGSGDVVNEFRMRLCMLNEIKSDDLDSLIKVWITDINRDIFILTPDSSGSDLPDEQIVLKWWREARGSEISTVDSSGSVKQLVGPGELKKSNKVRFKRIVLEQGVVKYDLSNGSTVILKPLGSPGSMTGKVRMNAFKLRGTNAFDEINSFLARASMDIVSNSGLGRMGPGELNAFLREKSTSITPYIYADVSGFNGVSTGENFEVLMQAFYKYFSDPIKNRSAFLIWRERQQLARNQRIPDGQQLFRDTIEAITGLRPPCEYCGGYNSDLDRIYSLYKSIFDDISGFTFVFSGEFDENVVFPIVLRYIQMLPGKGRSNNEIPAPGDHEKRIGGVCRTIYASGEMDRAYVELQIDLDTRYYLSAENNSNLGVFASLLQNKLTERLRAREGGTYVVIAQVNYMEYPFKRYQVRINFDCLPKDLQRLQRATMEELHLVANISETEFIQARAKESRNLDKKINNGAFWVSYLSKQVKLRANFSQVFEQLLFLKQLKFESFLRSMLDYTKNVSINNFTLLPRRYEGDITSICVTEFLKEICLFETNLFCPY